MYTRRGKGRPKAATTEDIRGVDNREFYLMGEDAPMTHLVRSYFASHGIHIDENRIVHRQTVDEAIDRISQDKGIGILPVGNAEKQAAAKSLVIFPLEEELVRRFSVIYPRRSAKQKAITAFKQTLFLHTPTGHVS